jgi:hypothetical protein
MTKANAELGEAVGRLTKLTNDRIWGTHHVLDLVKHYSPPDGTSLSDLFCKDLCLILAALASKGGDQGSSRDHDHTAGVALDECVVPKAPTMAMLNAAVDATGAGGGMSWVNRSPQKLFEQGYHVMLAAAPSSAKQVVGESSRDDLKADLAAMRERVERADIIVDLLARSRRTWGYEITSIADLDRMLEQFLALTEGPQP